MQIKETLSPAGASPEDISELEIRLGTPLADDYRQFLSHWNGGKPDKRQFTCVDGDNGGSIRAFFTIDRAAKYYNLHKEYEIYEERIPPKTLPIACDSFGNLVLLNLGTRGQHGAVYFWDHEEEELQEDEEAAWKNVYLAASSFQQFTDSLS